MTPDEVSQLKPGDFLRFNAVARSNKDVQRYCGQKDIPLDGLFRISGLNEFGGVVLVSKTSKEFSIHGDFLELAPPPRDGEMLVTVLDYPDVHSTRHPAERRPVKPGDSFRVTVGEGDVTWRGYDTLVYFLPYSAVEAWGPLPVGEATSS